MHNGYWGHSYGSPFNPKRISRETALEILKLFFSQSAKHPIAEMNEHLNDLVYTEVGSPLYKATLGNRIIGYYAPEDCVYEKGKADDKVYSFELG